MRTNKVILPFVGLTLSLLATPAAADMRCEGGLVNVGDSKGYVYEICGEPSFRDTIALDETSTTEGVVEQWTYNLGPGRFLRIVTFEAGLVSTIDRGDRR